VEEFGSGGVTEDAYEQAEEGCLMPVQHLLIFNGLRLIKNCVKKYGLLRIVLLLMKKKIERHS
jgi:hypothetical protein